MKRENSSAPHILNTSSNLLGICFLILTSLHILKVKNDTYIDEITIVAIVLFMSSCILSFLSMRIDGERSIRFESIADYTFMTGIFVLFTTTILIAVMKSV